MLLLFRPCLPRTRHDFRTQWLQSLQVLQSQVPQTLQGQTQPQKTRLDQSLQKTSRQITHQRLHLLIRKKTQRTPPVQPRNVRQNHPSHEKNCRYQRAKIGKVLAEQNETGQRAKDPRHEQRSINSLRLDQQQGAKGKNPVKRKRKTQREGREKQGEKRRHQNGTIIMNTDIFCMFFCWVSFLKYFNLTWNRACYSVHQINAYTIIIQKQEDSFHHGMVIKLGFIQKVFELIGALVLCTSSLFIDQVTDWNGFHCLWIKRHEKWWYCEPNQPHNNH